MAKDARCASKKNKPGNLETLPCILIASSRSWFELNNKNARWEGGWGGGRFKSGDRAATCPSQGKLFFAILQIFFYKFFIRYSFSCLSFRHVFFIFDFIFYWVIDASQSLFFFWSYFYFINFFFFNLSNTQGREVSQVDFAKSLHRIGHLKKKKICKLKSQKIRNTELSRPNMK